LLASILLSSCASSPPMKKTGYGLVPKPVKTIYQATYDYTWKVTFAEMQRYQLEIINKKAGNIQTSVQKNVDPDYPERLSHYIDIKLRSLPPVDKIPQTEVEITKFISTDPAIGMPKPIASDLIDEKVIHHRIKRLLEIERKKLEGNRK